MKNLRIVMNGEPFAGGYTGLTGENSGEYDGGGETALLRYVF